MPMEVELKFQVPLARRTALSRAMDTRTVQRTRLQAIYADTADDRLAAAGLALRLRKEGRLWVQTLKGRGDGLMQRLEHEVPLPAQRGEPALDPALHAGTPVGDLLQRALLGSAETPEMVKPKAKGKGKGKGKGATRAKGGVAVPAALAPLYRTDIQRLHRTVSQGGARIELALDEGWILAAGQRLPVFEIEFELKSGPPDALLALAQRWVQRFGLVWDVRTKSERGFRLAHGLLTVPAVRAPAVAWPREPPGPGEAGKGKGKGKAQAQSRSAAVEARVGAQTEAPAGPPGDSGLASPGARPSVRQAWSALLESALNQVLPNAAELACTQRVSSAARATCDEAAQAAEAAHLHQLRVGLRRLRTVLGLCADWGPDPATAQALQLAWREPFMHLGAVRDGDVLGGGLWPEILAAGGPASPPPQWVPGPADQRAEATSPRWPPEPGELLRDPAFTALLLQSLALSLPAGAGAGSGSGSGADTTAVAPRRPAARPSLREPAHVEADSPADAGADPATEGADPTALPDAAAQLLAHTWRQVRRDAGRFLGLPLERQHRARRRLKRLRYLLEGLLALPGGLGWPRAALRRWHRRLCRALDALGRYNDLCMADAALAASTAAATTADPGAWFARGWLAVQRPLAMAAAAQRLQRLVDTPTPWPKRRKTRRQAG